jgi:hypothetical protein
MVKRKQEDNPKISVRNIMYGCVKCHASRSTTHIQISELRGA